MRLSRRRLNRTLLRRQHLLVRAPLSPAAIAEHLVGLQAQEPMPPYLSLHARVEGFSPYDVSRGLVAGTLVRMGTLRGTLHVHVADDALGLRPWLQEAAEKQVRGRVGVDLDELADAVHALLADGPLPHADLGQQLAARFPGSPADLALVARVTNPLVQLPPRGTWKGSGGIVWDLLTRVAGAPLREVDAAEVVRRYLRAFGPAEPRDVTTWAGVTGLRPLVTGIADLVRHEDEEGRVLLDVPDGVIEDEDVPAPVRLLGVYDNLWLSHAARDRVTEPRTRAGWMGPNGGNACTVFVDGWLAGLWRVEDGRARVVELFRDLTPDEREELDEELGRVDALLAT